MRTTRSMLQHKVDTLNRLLGLPADVVSRDEKGKIVRGADGAPLRTHGCITLDRYQPGDARHTWAVNMVRADTGEHLLNRHQGRMTTDECNAFLSGMLAVLEDVPVYRKP